MPYKNNKRWGEWSILCLRSNTCKETTLDNMTIPTFMYLNSQLSLHIYF
jgi:hypothetical protein